jgi:dimeric dUTPase (all-alpha-NTP-PPase superfamily)
MSNTSEKSIDFLRIMLDMQKTLQETAYGYSFDDLVPKDRTALIKEMSIHVNQEMNELLYELPFFKPWKKYDGMTEKETTEAYNKAKKEFIDFIHFALNVAILLDMSADEIFTEYYNKNQENYERQTRGYTHDVKYR